MGKIRLQSEASVESNEELEKLEEPEKLENVESVENDNVEQIEKPTTEKVGSKVFNIRWGIIGGACAILVFYLTVGFVVSWMILDKIAAQTSHSASPFGTWWQVLVFVLDVVFVLGAVGAYAMMIVGSTKRRKAHAAQ